MISPKERYRERCQELLSMKNDLPTEYPLTPYNWDPFYREEAYGSFCNQFFISTILNASALVESMLYFEYIRKTYKYQEAGASLPDRVSLGTLYKCLKNEIKDPINELIDEDETDITNPNDLKFIKYRNTFSHGALIIVTKFPSAYLPRSDVAAKYGIVDEEYFVNPIDKWIFENLAFIQIVKSFKFVKKYIKYIKENYDRTE